MSNMAQLLDQIKTATFGEDVRGSIHDGIKECYEDTVQTRTLAEKTAQKVEEALGDGTMNEIISNEELEEICQ